MKKLTLTLAVAVVSAGCASLVTPYQDNGILGGYKEKKLSASAWKVDFVANALLDELKVKNYLQYRCAELCVENGFDWFEVWDLEPVHPHLSHRCRITCGHNPRPTASNAFDARATIQYLEPGIER